MIAHKQKRQLRSGILIGLITILFISATLDQLINVSVLNEAEKVIGLNFTEAEKDSMLDNLNENLEYSID